MSKIGKYLERIVSKELAMEGDKVHVSLSWKTCHTERITITLTDRGVTATGAIDIDPHAKFGVSLKTNAQQAAKTALEILKKAIDRKADEINQ